MRGVAKSIQFCRRWKIRCWLLALADFHFGSKKSQVLFCTSSTSACISFVLNFFFRFWLGLLECKCEIELSDEDEEFGVGLPRLVLLRDWLKKLGFGFGLCNWLGVGSVLGTVLLLVDVPKRSLRELLVGRRRMTHPISFFISNSVSSGSSGSSGSVVGFGLIALCRWVKWAFYTTAATASTSTSGTSILAWLAAVAVAPSSPSPWQTKAWRCVALHGAGVGVGGWSRI